MIFSTLNIAKEQFISAPLGDKALFLSSFFTPLIAGLFFYCDTCVLRRLFYISIPISLFLISKNKVLLRKLFRDNKSIWIFLGGFVIYMTMSVLWSETEEVGRYFEKAKLIFILGTGVLSSFLISYKIPSFFEYMKRFFVFSAITSAIFLIFNYLSTHGLSISGSRMEGMGRARNPVQASLLYGLAIIAITSLKLPEKLTTAQQILFKTLMSLPPFIVMLLTESRGPLLALILTLTTLLILRSKNRLKVFLGLFVVLICLSGLAFDVLKDTSLMERKSTGRVDIWTQAIHEISQSPIIGYGLASNRSYNYKTPEGSIFQVNHIHSLYLSTLFQGGIIGLGLLISIYALMFRKYISLINQQNTEIIWLGGWMMMGAIFGIYDFGGIIINISTEWLVFWWPVALTLGYLARIQSKSTPLPQSHTEYR
jgi:O-antigen ligase